MSPQLPPSLLLPEYARVDLATAQVVAVASPPAGSGITHVPQEGFIELVTTLVVILTTSATVAQRTLTVKYQPPAATVAVVVPVSQQAASAQVTYTFALTVEFAWQTGTFAVTPLPALSLEAGGKLVVEVNNMQAADALSQVALAVVQVPTGPPLAQAPLEPTLLVA